MNDADLSSVNGAAPHRGIRQRLGAGLSESLGGNATAFGYSVTITASFGAAELGLGQPSFGELILFGLGAVIAFGGLEGLLSRGFRVPLEKGIDQVVALGTALAFISIVLPISTARGIDAILAGGWGGSGQRLVRHWRSPSSKALSSCLRNGCRSGAANPTMRADRARAITRGAQR